MRRTTARPAFWACLALIGMSAGGAARGEAPAVNESARQIPVAYQVDVVVVGGSTGAVAAAVAAAKEGAKVFLAAPRPYLGDDMTATLRLWLEPGEEPATPLAKRVFDDAAAGAGGPDPNRIPCKYEADRPSAAVHKDTKPPTRLTDGLWGSASSQSVQYDGDVDLIVDLEKSHQIELARVVCYQRDSVDKKTTGFKVGSIAVSTSDDRKDWKESGVVLNDKPLKADGAGDGMVTLAVPVKAAARYLKISVKKADAVGRVLLGEIEIVGPARAVAETPPKRPMPRPMHVKKTLDEALLEAGVPFLYSCSATDVLRDKDGNPCGIVMANRAGRQAVIAKRIIDATERATVARLAGAKLGRYPAGMHTFRRVVIGGKARSGPHMTARTIAPGFRDRVPNPVEGSGGLYDVIEYTLNIPMAGDSPAAWAKAEQAARTMTYDPDQQFTSDALFEVPPDAMAAEPAPPVLPGKHVSLAALTEYRVPSAPGLFILGGCAAVSRVEAESLLRPAALMALGERLGKAAAGEAKGLPRPDGARLSGKPVDMPAAPGDVREVLAGVRPTEEVPTVPQDARAVPVIGRYDVVVIGGGTAGAPAGIGAARQGAKTLVVEHIHGLGGVGTVGAISSYYWGNRVGFTATVPESKTWVIERRMEWWRSELLNAGADIWFGTTGCGVFVEDGQVKGAVLVTPQGRGVVLAKAVIDATGNSDVAAAAGAQCDYTGGGELAMQGTGLPPRRLGTTYTNTDFTIADETDMVDIWHLFVYAKGKYADAFDQGQLIDTRERRRIVGDFTIDLLDQVLGRTYPDSVVAAFSNFDSHGYTISPYLELEHPGHKGYRIYVPYRCMLPKALEGLLVVGLGISAHRDAVPMIRMQADIQNGGYAAGVAAAMAASGGLPLRKIDVRKLQKHLVEIGNLPESVLTDEDSFPPSPERVAAAVESVKDKFRDVAVLLAQPKEALPLLRKAYLDAAQEKDKLAYARVLAVLGDAAGVETLMAEVRRVKQWDKGWDYVGMGQFGTALSPLDQLIVALGRTGDPRAVPVIVEKAETLTAASEFSHHRAVGLALELIGDRAAAKPLAGMLTQPDMSGYVHDSVQEARRRDQESPGGTNAVRTRRDSIRELFLARALYRCGDYGGVGKEILTRYTKALRGHLARHAKAVLEKTPPPKP
jgi:hypothetical protein